MIELGWKTVFVVVISNLQGFGFMSPLLYVLDDYSKGVRMSLLLGYKPQTKFFVFLKSSPTHLEFLVQPLVRHHQFIGEVGFCGDDQLKLESYLVKVVV